VTGSLDTMVFVWSLKEILAPALPTPPPVPPTPSSIIPPTAPPPSVAPAPAPTFLSLPLPDFIVNTTSSSSAESASAGAAPAAPGPDDEDFDLFERFESLKTSGTVTEFVANGGTETEANGQGTGGLPLRASRPPSNSDAQYVLHKDEQTALFRPRCMLRGHDDGVTCVGISTEYGTHHTARARVL
jgi:hypothetical protein